MRYKYIFLGLIVGLAFVLRFVGISSYPAGFSADEVNQGYTAYSILKTGRDEWGDLFPVAPRAYGDYRAPLYTYLTVPSVFLFGLNEFAVRFPNVLVGTIAILVLYLLSKELFKNFKNSEAISLLAASILAISPWHVGMSRGSFETNLPSLLIPLASLFFLKGLDKKKYMLASMICFGFSLFSYYSARLLLPFVLLAFYLLFVRPKFGVLQAVKKFKLSLIVFAIFAFLASYTMFFGAQTRIADVALFNSEAIFRTAADQKYQAVLLGLPDTIARLFSNKVFAVGEQIIKNYLGYFSIEFLFTQGAGEATYGLMPGRGLLHLIELPFLLFSIYSILQNKLYRDRRILFILVVIAMAPIPASLTASVGFAANRSALMIPWIHILAAYGAIALASKIKIKKIWIAFATFYVFATVLFLEDYFFHAPMQNSRQMSYGWKQMASYLDEVSDSYPQVIISRNLSEPQMFLAFYLKIDPRVVQKESQDWLRYQANGLKFVDQLGEYKIANFTIRNLDRNSDLRLDSALLVGKPEDFPHDIVPSYSVNYPDGQQAIIAVSTRAEYAKGN